MGGCPHLASMGPLVLTSGRQIAWQAIELGKARLQWGRWFSPAEGVPLHCHFQRVVPSMGPLVLTSGRDPRGRVLVVALCGLQWGRWFSPAEGVHDEKVGPVGIHTFNGAAGSHQRKVVSLLPRLKGRLHLQWGRWFSPAEGTHATSIAVHQHVPSMGPLVLTSGRGCM